MRARHAGRCRYLSCILSVEHVSFDEGEDGHDSIVPDREGAPMNADRRDDLRHRLTRFKSHVMTPAQFLGAAPGRADVDDDTRSVVRGCPDLSLIPVVNLRLQGHRRR